MFDEIENLPKKYPCPICAELKKIGISKKDKPYYFCDYCGVQVFIRGKLGIQKLIELNNNGIIKNMVSDNPQSIWGLIQLDNKINYLKSEINKIEDKSDEIDLNKLEIETLSNLKTNLENLETEYLTKLGEL